MLCDDKDTQREDHCVMEEEIEFCVALSQRMPKTVATTRG